VSFALGLVSLVSGLVGCQSVKILISVKKQVVATNIVAQMLS
jgi:hypothetical protein